MKKIASIAIILLTLFAAGAAHAQFKTGERATEKQIKDFLGGYTIMTYSSGHGTQVEYYSKRGKSYLFYPGNKVVVQGKWFVVQSSNIMPIGLCFDYGPNTYNPVTKQGGGLSCDDWRRVYSGIKERVRGDVLGLSKSQSVPFVLSKRKTTIDALKGKL